MRKSATLFVVLGLVAGLTACSAAEEPAKEDSAAGSAECLVKNGTGSDAVTVDGEFGTKPTVTFDFPVSTKKTERTVVAPGEGDPVASGDVISVDFALYNATSGQEISNTGFAEGTPTEFTVSEEAILPGLVKTLQCAPIGSRVVAVIPPTDMWGEQGYPDFGVAGTDSVVIVADVVKAIPPLSAGEWTENIPEVKQGDKPVVTLPDGEAPDELLLTVLEKGDGAKVEATDTVTLDYQGTSWQTGEVFDESYGKEPITLAANQFVKGFTAALVGQKVGSTVLVTIPAEYAYGADPDAHELGGQDLVFLIQIRDVA